MKSSLRFNEWLYHKILVIRTNIHLGQLNFKLIHFFEGAFTKYTASARQPNKLQACYKWTCFSGADLRIICLILYWDLCGWSTINNPNMRESNIILYASTTSLRDLQALSPYDPCRLPLTLCPCSVGRVEKSKNGINSYGYCFLVAFWYVETRKNNFFGQRNFLLGIFLLGGI